MNVIPFQFESNPVRVVTDDKGCPWFVAADLCKAIGLSDHKGSYKHHLEKLDDDERASVPRTLVQGTPTSNMGVIAKAFVEAAGGATWAEPEMWTVSESGAYALILRSRDATTPGTVQHRFRKWITSEVLPSIRKTGTYSAKSVRPSAISRNQIAASILLLRSAAEDLKLAPSAVLVGYQKLEEKLGVTGLLPGYAVDDGGAGGGSSRTTNSATWLLKEHGSKVSASKFNEALIKLGFLEEKSRSSTKVAGKIKHYKSITSAGLAYGKNATNPANQKETQPLWFEDSFADLLDLVTNMIENAKNEELDSKKENHDK